MKRVSTLEEAKALALAGDYRGALRLLDGILGVNPRDIDALRLKGNSIELEVMEREAGQAMKYVHSARFEKARACYDQILLLQPNHLGALADLGTHWKNLGNESKALAYYNKVLDLCKDLSSADHDELVEALQGKIEIVREQGLTSELTQLEEKLRTIQRS